MSGWRWIRWSGVTLTLIAASSYPLHLFAVNVVGIVRPERVVALALLAWGLGLFLIWLLVALGVDVSSAEYTSFVVIVFVMNGGPILRRFDSLGYLILIVCPILAGWLAVRMGDHVLVKALVWGAAIAVASGPLVTFFASWPTTEQPSVLVERPSMAIEMTKRPDIFLVVFDGYPGVIAAQQDGLPAGDVDVLSELRVRGFDIPPSSWSSYWTTMLSIPSLLDMGYPVEQDPWRTVATRTRLQNVTSGASASVETLKKNGYKTHMIESGWSGASCGPEFDICVPSPWIDEATYLILRHTAASAALDGSPGPYVLGTLAGFEWLFGHAPDLSQSKVPDFVFMHVVSPHPPLLLTEDCSPDLSPGRAGTGFNVPGVDTGTRDTYLVEQIDCMDRMMIELADSVAPNDVVIFVSDHGTDRRYQANPDNVDWDRETTIERLNNFLAVRLPNGCALGDEVMVPNVLRLVLGCFTDTEIEALPHRMWVNPLEELEPRVVKELLDMRGPSG